MSGDRTLRLSGAALALAAALIHLALALADLIPGEKTATPAFALMAAGFAGCAAAMFSRQKELAGVVAVYAGALILAYWGSRATLPVEAIGLTAQVTELALAGVAIALLRRP